MTPASRGGSPRDPAASPAPRPRAVLPVFLALLAAMAGPDCAAEPALFAATATPRELKFGGDAGSGLAWKGAGASPSASVGFGGRAALSCSGLDYGGFLTGFKAGDFVREMRGQLIGGAQAAVTNYLLILAYSNPTLASVLDTMNQSYGAKFGSFQLACNAQEARKRGATLGGRRMAAAQDQCYEAQVQDGASPTEAYQTCAKEEGLGAMAARLPAAKPVLEFLRAHTTLELSPATTALFGLLPDLRIAGSGVELAPPKTSLQQFHAGIQSRVAGALQQVLDGTPPASVPECRADADAVAASAGSACIPAGFADLVRSGPFLAARQLSSAGRALYRDALASQVAGATIRGAVLDLRSQVRQMGVRAGSGATGAEVLDRRNELEEQIAALEKQVDALQAYQQARAAAIRTQILALDLAAPATAGSASSGVPGPAPRGSAALSVLRSLVGR